MPHSAKLTGDLLVHLKRIREEKGEKITINDITSLVEELSAQIKNTASEQEKLIQKELQDIVTRLEETKTDICSFASSSAQQENITDASQQLDAVVKATEDASNAIMDAADAIMGLATNMPPETGGPVTEAVTRIFEACNFQDLTSQRIRKVLSTLTYIEEHIQNLAALFGHDLSGKPAQPKVVKTLEESLMNGPQMGATPNQADIDALFAKAK